MDATPLTTAADVVKALGGLGAMAKIVRRSPQNVWNWKAANRFPPYTYLLIRDALEARGKCATPDLWNMAEPNREAADA